jgi:hypothetical protein
MRRCVAIGAMLVAGRLVTFPKIFIKQDVTGAASLQRVTATIGLFGLIADLARSRAPFIRDILGEHCRYTLRALILGNWNDPDDTQMAVPVLVFGRRLPVRQRRPSREFLCLPVDRS